MVKLSEAIVEQARMSYRRVIRRILGRSLTFKLRNLISEVSYRMGFIPPATSVDKKEGISAMVCTMNEKEWVEPSILSVKDLVDEYVVIDSSTDSTPQIIENLTKEHGLNLKMERIPAGDMVKARTLALKLAEYKWILCWDADFIAKEEMPKHLRNLIEELDPKRYYLVYWPHICLDRDLFHQNPKAKLHIEHWLFTYSPKLRYIRIKHFEVLVAPITYYKTIYIDKPLSFHLRTVKDPVRVLYRYLRSAMIKEGLEGKISFEEYVKIKIREVYGTSDIKEAANIHLKERTKFLNKYDKTVFGDYPRILKEYVKKKYGINL